MTAFRVPCLVALSCSLLLATGCRRQKKGAPPDPNAAAAASADPALAESEEPSIPPAPLEFLSRPPDATVTASGLAYKVLKSGTGQEHPGPEDEVMINFTGWTAEGAGFDSTESQGGKPAKLRLGRVIAGLTEGLQVLTVGSKAVFWIPENLGYLEDMQASTQPKGKLIIEAELVEIKRAPTAPPDVSAPPSTATKTASGLFYRVLEKGKGARHPKGTDKVRVHYIGWTTDGRFYASTGEGRKPTHVRVDEVVKGLAEGFQLMVEGEKMRFWIPAELAFGVASRTNVPAGMVVFDVELLSID
jgi:FKBP-type peptidyl-prolyl cis-trans isomerase